MTICARWGTARRRVPCMLVAALGLALPAPDAGAQSAADRGDQLIIDAQLDDWQAVECVFRTSVVCSALALPACDDEEPRDDSSWSRLQDVAQVKVTWDATHLYLAVEAIIADHALILLLDTDAGGLQDMTALRAWRRAIRFSDAFRPDFILAVRDGQRQPELWRVAGVQNLERIHADDFEATASFQVESQGRALEAALPWSLVFPDAPRLVNPDSLAPPEPMFVLPPAAAEQGLRLQAVVVHAAEALGAADVAPDATQPLPLSFRDPVTLDRAARIDWRAGSQPEFVAFGRAVQTQVTPRFVPDGSTAVSAPLSLRALETFDAQAPYPATRLLLADAGRALGFTFEFDNADVTEIYVSATIYSMRGEPVQVLYENSRRLAGVAMPPWGRFSMPALDRWQGQGRRGAAADAGMYLLRIDAGLAPGTTNARQQRTIVVVR